MNIRFSQIESETESLLEYTFKINDTGLGELTLKGDCGYGSKGNQDGEFMYKIVRLVLERTDIMKLIVDLRDLNYEWGNYVSKMLFDLFDAKISIAVLYSEKSKAILPSDDEIFFRTVENAVKFINTEK